MALILGKVKCFFCNDKDGVIHSVCNYGIYGGARQRTFYHLECLELVETYPETFGHKMMDKAIWINEQAKRCMKNCNENIIKNFNDKIEKLHRSNFERMMPK